MRAHWLAAASALAHHRVVRAIQDVDLLTDADQSAAVGRELVSLDYECIHQSDESATCIRGDERVDFLFARRPTARLLLAEAGSRMTPFGALRVISLEGLIALGRRPEQAARPTLAAVLVADGGSPAAPRLTRDPFETPDDLVAVA